MRNSLFALTFAALAMASATVAPAFADTRDHPPTVTVAYDDLSLGRTDDAAAMLVRLEDASRRVCSSAGHGLRGLARYEARRTCRAEALERAVTGLDAPVVTALHQGEPPAFQTAMR
jgi:UrcA family protein